MLKISSLLGNWLQIIKLCVNLKSAIHRCNAVDPKVVMGEPSAVFNLAGSILVIMVRTSGVAIMPVGGITPVVCWCARQWYLIQAVHGNMSVIITVIAPYMGAIVCHMANFLTLKTPVIITGHSVDQRGGVKVWKLFAVWPGVF